MKNIIVYVRHDKATFIWYNTSNEYNNETKNIEKNKHTFVHTTNKILNSEGIPTFLRCGILLDKIKYNRMF